MRQKSTKSTSGVTIVEPKHEKHISEMTYKEAHEASVAHRTTSHGGEFLDDCKICVMYAIQITRLHRARVHMVYTEAMQEFPPDGVEKHEFVGNDGQNCVVCGTPERNPIHRLPPKKDQPA